MTFSTESISLNSAFCGAYFGLLLLSMKRAYVLSSSEDANGPRHIRFFFSIMVHCPLRITVALFQFFSKSSQNSAGYATNKTETLVTALPIVSFQTSMYIYLRIWQRQCEHLDASRPAPVIRQGYLVAWYITWLVLAGLDILLDEANINNEALSVVLFGIVNFVFIACGFAYLGERVYASIASVRTFTGSTSAEMYEQHVIRVKWFFGMACISHGVINILQLWITNSVLFGWEYWGIVYYTFIELLPLIGAILSITYIQQEISGNYVSARAVLDE